MVNVSLIMPTYNKANYLELTLAAYCKQEYKDFELIIIDDGSTDPTCLIINKYKAWLNICYIKLERHTNASTARNKGLYAAKGTIIINVDDDRIPITNFIKEHVEFLREHPKTVSIGNKYSILSIYSEELKINQSKLLEYMKRNPEFTNRITNNNRYLVTPEDLINDCDIQLAQHYLYEPADNFKFIRNVYGDELEGFYFGWIMATGGNMAFDRTYALDTYFDENYEGWGCEDCDFSYQLFKNGYHFHFLENAINYHQEHPRKPDEWESLKKTLKQFCNKFDTIETYLWARTFKYEKQFNHFDANEIYKNIASDTEQYKDLLSNYKDLCKEDLSIWWGNL